MSYLTSLKVSVIFSSRKIILRTTVWLWKLCPIVSVAFLSQCLTTAYTPRTVVFIIGSIGRKAVSILGIVIIIRNGGYLVLVFNFFKNIVICLFSWFKYQIHSLTMDGTQKVVTWSFWDDSGDASSFPGPFFLQHCIIIKDSVIFFVES